MPDALRQVPMSADKTHALEIAHVLFLDLVGYSLLPMDQQRGILRSLQNAVRKTTDFLRAKANEQLISLPTGDGMALVFFGDPEAAARCALELAVAVRADSEIKLRMGLHTGPVYRVADINSNLNVSGGGINIAQRVMDCGDAGHILLSNVVAEVLQQLGRWNDHLHDLGETEVKHGIRLHLFSLYRGDVGNPVVPRKLLPSKGKTKHKIREATQQKPTDGMLGRSVSHYVISRRLGGGGMGVVYEALDKRLNRHVALKFIHEDLCTNKATIERFQREACAASALNHPNICTVHDVGEHEGRHFIVMELLEGTTLAKLIEGRPMELRQILELAIQVTDALETAHGKDILHRDIKPANIFVTSRGQAKIMDFGLAKFGVGRRKGARGSTATTTADEHLTHPGEFVGTIAYTSPEQARGQELDQRSDLFSFGVVLYEMATGLPPFRGDTSAVVFDAILNRPPVSSVRSNPNVPAGLEAIINRALEKDRDLRYQTAAEIHADLRRLSMGLGGAIDSVPTVPAEAAPMNVILLYRRDIQPDQQLLQLLEPQLVKNGCSVFVDRRLTVGMEWASEIEHRIATADAVIALLSATSVQSEMLTYEVQKAYEYAQKQGGKPRLLPVRVDFEGSLPDSVSGILEGIQYASWKGPQDNESVVSAVLASLHTPPQKFLRPIKLESVGGAIPLDSNFYIVRPTDQDFCSAISQRDSIVLIKGARQMGKTSLMARGLHQARAGGAKVVFTDFQKLNSGHLQTAETLFLALAETLAEQLGCDINLEQTWNARKGPSTNFERFLRREILANVRARLVWAMDEVDRLFSCSFGSEVFGLFRSWHNERSLNPEGPWQKLTLVIAYATEAHLFITDVNQSPFNVGTRLVLADFTLEQVQELNRRYGSPLKTTEEIDQFFELLCGQPYLTQKGLHEMVAHQLDFRAFVATAAKDEGPYGDHLRRILVSLAQDAQLCEVVRSVLNGRHSSTADAFYRLRSSGIMSGESAREMKPRCQLYETYLSRHLL
jgi:serine/threonine protein kinase/class 3 adenylate cyclase